MNRKVRSDCKLKGLHVAQRLRVDGWLFEEGWTYAAVVEGCLEQFGLELGKSSVGRYYERASADRLAKKRRKERMEWVPKLDLDPAAVYRVLLGKIGELAMRESRRLLQKCRQSEFHRAGRNDVLSLIDLNSRDRH